MTPTPTIFAPLFIAATALFLWSCWKRLSLTAVGRADNRLADIGRRLVDTLGYAFAQRRVLAKASGMIHLAIFWCFLVLMVANAEFLLHGLFPAISFSRLPDGLFVPVMQTIDAVSLVALIAVTAAAVRRIVAPPYPEARTAEAFFILFLIALLMLANFGVNAAKISAMAPTTQQIAKETFPISGWFVHFIPPDQGKLVHDLSWWTHAVVLLLFMNLLPLSKHFHIITAIPNIFLRRFEQPVLPERERFEAGNRFGVDRVDGYTWKELLDAFSCTECGRCQNACPAHTTGKPLNPRRIIHDLKLNLLKNGPALGQGDNALQPLIGEGAGSIGEEAIWACTTCGACLESCPVFIEQMPKLIPLRRHLVEMESKFPEELLNLFENMEGRSNPWGIAPSERGKWATLLGERPFVPGSTEYLFYVGCAGSFDSRAKQVTLALAQLLDKAGVSWGILGREELCCGDSLRRLGNEYVFDRLATQNVALFKERGVSKVIVQCPHCLTTLKNDYRQYGIELDVIHHSQLLLHLAQDGRLTLPRKATELGATLYHDSCYLGRHNGIYDEPREALALATGAAPKEMERSRENGFCCGAGGGRMWMEEFTGERINLVRVQEAMAQQPDTVCTACPYCLTMFEDGLKDLRQNDRVRVRDIAEIMADAALRPASPT
ncbi:(Fe-S)-binding protein [Trichlorobacter ammonificans]|uniref:EtfAB:quinone oxidoreductase n=1 Tax=Trichlorobacter ammonificans TaxID=2916410 RepID=A0ABN8HFZ1_9BACT|nr:(Fe-S)-binding protein [Trichlorobacter ammonificans]CAH2030034.1 putative EtfAB:quinone oxidoreductase [Trichlorobacter ammonificans]